MTSHELQRQVIERCAKETERFGQGMPTLHQREAFVELAARLRSLPPSGEDGVVVPRETLQRAIRFLSGEVTTNPPFGFISEMRAMLSAAQGEDQAAKAATEKAGSIPAQSQRSGETGGRFDSGVVDSGEQKARPASVVSSSGESEDQSNEQAQPTGAQQEAAPQGVSYEVETTASRVAPADAAPSNIVLLTGLQSPDQGNQAA